MVECENKHSLSGHTLLALQKLNSIILKSEGVLSLDCMKLEM